MIKAGVIGFGKMGMTHYAQLNQNPKVQIVAICDNSNFILTVMSKYTDVKCYKDYKKMIEECSLQAVVVATPTSSHAEIVRYAVDKGLHVFVEKPFCLDTIQGREIVVLAEERKVVTQVGYHC